MLEEVRKQIDAIDEELVRLLEERYDCVSEVGRLKKEHGVPILDSQREVELLEKVKRLVINKNYEASLVETFQGIMDVSKDYQQQHTR